MATMEVEMGRKHGQDGDRRGTVGQIQEEEEVEILGDPSPGAAGDHLSQTKLQLLASLPSCAGMGSTIIFYYTWCLSVCRNGHFSCILFREAPGGPARCSLLPAAPPHQGRLQGGGGQALSGGGGAGQALSSLSSWISQNFHCHILHNY